MNATTQSGTKIAALIAGLALALIATVAAAAPRGDDSARKSKNGKAEGTAGGAKVTIEYGRPSVGGRTIWGALVPYGQVWRAGADEATTIAFDKDVKIEGQKLAAGRYALFLIPSEGDWTVVFNSVADQWGAFKHDPSKDVLRATVKPGTGAMTEALEYTIAGDRVEMRWEKVAVGFTVSPAG
jgi:hypothetical protein